MKFVMIFLVLSLVVLMADPGDCFFKSAWRGVKAVFKGARAGWKGKSTTVMQTEQLKYPNAHISLAFVA
uniref:Uncharacterized protein n=1 Tax=Nothobranchius furzeri TaxID=105023 RepID=A0A8C6KPQ1_NOTFU